MTRDKDDADQHDPAQGGIVPPWLQDRIKLRNQLSEWIAEWTTAHPVNSVEDFHAYPDRLADALISAGWITSEERP